MRVTLFALLLCVAACSGKEQKQKPLDKAPETAESPNAPQAPEPATTGADHREPATTAPEDKAPKDKAGGGAAPVPAAAGAAVAPAKQQVAVIAMVGPKGSLKALCGKSDTCMTEPPGPDEKFSGEPSYSVTKASALAAPFEDARVIVFEEPELVFQCKLAVKIAGQWYLEGGEGEECWSQDSRSSTVTEVRELVVREFAFGGGPEVVLRTAMALSMANMDNDGASVDEKTETLTVCGVGASGKPGCFKLDTGGSWEAEKYDPKAPNADLAKDLKEGKGSWKVAISWQDGAMVVTGDAPQDGHGWRDRRGLHTGLRWP